MPSSNSTAQNIGGTLEARLKAAKSFVDADDLDSALEAYESVLKENPDIASAYLGIGAIYMKKGNEKEAESYVNGALHVDRKFAPAIFMLANINAKRGDTDKALRQYLEVLEISPKMIKPRISISRIYIKKERFEEAIALLEETLNYNPQHSEARLMLANILHKQNQTGKAIEAIKKLLAREPDSWKAYFILGRLFAADEKFSDAVSALNKSIDIQPDNAQAIYFLGGIYLKTKDYDQAIHSFKEALKLNPKGNEVDVKIRLSTAYIDKTDFVNAEKLLCELSLGERKLGIVHFMLAKTYLQQKKYLQAVEEFESVMLQKTDLTTKYPELAALKKQELDDEAKAVAYDDLISKIKDEEGAALNDDVEREDSISNNKNDEDNKQD